VAGSLVSRIAGHALCGFWSLLPHAAPAGEISQSVDRLRGESFPPVTLKRRDEWGILSSNLSAGRADARRKSRFSSALRKISISFSRT